MMDRNAFDRIVTAIQQLGYDESTAVRYAVLIGDTPSLDDDGKVVVTDEHGDVLARLDLGLDE